MKRVAIEASCEMHAAAPSFIFMLPSRYQTTEPPNDMRVYRREYLCAMYLYWSCVVSSYLY